MPEKKLSELEHFWVLGTKTKDGSENEGKIKVDIKSLGGSSTQIDAATLVQILSTMPNTLKYELRQELNTNYLYFTTEEIKSKVVDVRRQRSLSAIMNEANWDVVQIDEEEYCLEQVVAGADAWKVYVNGQYEPDLEEALYGDGYTDVSDIFDAEEGTYFIIVRDDGKVFCVTNLKEN